MTLAHESNTYSTLVRVDNTVGQGCELGRFLYRV